MLDKFTNRIIEECNIKEHQDSEVGSIVVNSNIGMVKRIVGCTDVDTCDNLADKLNQVDITTQPLSVGECKKALIDACE